MTVIGDGRRREDAARVGARRRGSATYATVAAGRCLPYGDGITFWPLTELIQRLGGEQAMAEAMGDDPDATLVVERLRVLGGQRDRAAGGALLGGPAALRAPRAQAAAPRRPGGRPLGRADAARPRRAREPLEPRRARSSSSASRVPSCSRSGPSGRACTCASSRSRTAKRRSFSTRSTPVASSPRSSGAASPRLRRGIRSTPSSSSRCLPTRLATPSSSSRCRRRSRPCSPRGSTASIRSSGRCSQRAAVVGKEFWPGAVAALDGGDETLGATLLGLVRRELVEPAVSSIPGQDGFRFRHALIRDAAYAGIPKRTARRPPRAFRRLARAPRHSRRVRGLPPRAGVPLSRRARIAR